MIKLEKIQHTYQGKKVIQNLSITIPPNQLTCILGNSGCGKTTLLKIISGLETPSCGTVTINNLTVTKEEKILIAPDKRNLGFIFQDLALWPHFTVYQNIVFGLNHKKKKEQKKIAIEMLNYLEILEQKEKYPHQLSGGQQQLVAIARSLVLKPKILLMDEPLANLDVKLKRKILKLIKDLIVRFKITILYVTHDHREAFAIADKIIILNEGKVEETGTVDQIKKSKNEYLRYFIEY